MTAQLGSAVLLDYGPQGSQQLGSAIVLDTVVAATSLRINASARAPWVASARREKTLESVSDTSHPSDAQARAPWHVGSACDEGNTSAWIVAERADEAAHAPWGRYGARAEPHNVSRWVAPAIADEAARAPWGRYAGRAEPSNLSRWVVGLATDLAAVAPWLGPMVPIEALRAAPFSRSLARDMAQVLPWLRYSRVIQPGWGVEIPPWDGIPTPQIVVPIRSVYVQVNATSLRRASDLVEVRTFNMSMSIDKSSWVWSFSASVDAAALDLVSPVDGEPVELEALVNGTMFRFIVERISRDRQFSKSSLSISGRGKAAYLDAPYAPVMNFGNTEARTVQQIMGDVLTVNGVPMGWDVNFTLTDWLVPAGVFAHTGTYASALNRIAEAGGAYLQADRDTQTLHLLPAYPFMPYEWATMVDPDFELPSAPVQREAIEWVDLPRYNRVYVVGQQQGVRGRVTRAGTAGDLAAQTIVDPLATHADAARQRGRPVLAEVGRIAYVDLRLPVLTETGVITPGKFVRYVDGATTRIGLVRSVSLEVAMPQVWQTIKLETHLEPV